MKHFLFCIVCCLGYYSVAAQNGETFPCTADAEAACLSTNQSCVQLPSQDDGFCFTCLPGFVKVEEQCINIATELTMDAYVAAFPNATFLLRPDITMEERLANLRRNAEYIAEINQNYTTFQLELNEYSAETLEERSARNGFRAADGDSVDDVPIFQSSTDSSLPAEVDWVKEGMVTPVKNQLYCGCCWSVAAIGAIESQYAISMSQMGEGPEDIGIGFSFQQLISCDDDNSGCNGGVTKWALQYAHDNSFGGVATFRDYPYEDRGGATTETCQLSGLEPAYSPPETRKVIDALDRLSFEERLLRMKQALAQQPVAVAMKANCNLISNYGGGVMTTDGDCACSSSNCRDHAVLMVGYNDNHDPPYLLVKNSWGQSYGEEGYFRVAQTAKGDYGLFALLSEGYIPSTNDEFDVAKDPLKFWQILLIAIGSALVFAAVGFALQRCWQSRSSSAQGD